MGKRITEDNLEGKISKNVSRLEEHNYSGSAALK